MATAVGDRGDHPKRKIKYADMNVKKNDNGSYNIYHMDDTDHLYSKQYYGYSKKDAMKLHKRNYESGK